MDISMLSRRDDILNLIVERLGRSPVDFSEKMSLIGAGKRGDKTRAAAGVLLPLSFEGEFVLQLIKRSSGVSQPGDISCPGGMLNTFLDPLLRPFVVHILRGKALKCARKRERDTFRNITLFLASALRESWEEVRLNPLRVVFLGPLPCRDLTSLKRTIFPLVGYIKNEWCFRPNREVEKIVEIPLRAFLEDENYGLCILDAPIEIMERINLKRDYPCFMYHDEMLWGATFSVIMNFLKIVFDFKLPESYLKRVVKKKLYSDYLTGKRPDPYYGKHVVKSCYF